MSTLAVGTIQSNTTSPPVIRNSGGTEVGTFCRAWVNFNGAGVVAIRASFNVTSITDNGVGDYTVNFTNAMPDVNYGFFVGVRASDVNYTHMGYSHLDIPPATGSLRVSTAQTNASATAATDKDIVTVSVFR